MSAKSHYEGQKDALLRLEPVLRDQLARDDEVDGEVPREPREAVVRAVAQRDGPLAAAAREQRPARPRGVLREGVHECSAHEAVRGLEEAVRCLPVAAVLERESAGAGVREVVLADDEAGEAQEGEVGLGEGPVRPLGFV